MSNTHRFIERIGLTGSNRNLACTETVGDPYHLLAAAIIHQAVIDARMCREINNDFSCELVNKSYPQQFCSALNLMEFFYSEWMEELLCWSDIQPASIWELMEKEIGKLAVEENARNQGNRKKGRKRNAAIR